MPRGRKRKDAEKTFTIEVNGDELAYLVATTSSDVKACRDYIDKSKVILSHYDSLPDAKDVEVARADSIRASVAKVERGQELRESVYAKIKDATATKEEGGE